MYKGEITMKIKNLIQQAFIMVLLITLLVVPCIQAKAVGYDYKSAPVTKTNDNSMFAYIVYNGTIEQNNQYLASFKLQNVDTESTYTTINWFVEYPGRQELIPVEQHTKTVNIPLLNSLKFRSIKVMCVVENANGYKTFVNNFNKDQLLNNIQVVKHKTPVIERTARTLGVAFITGFFAIAIFLMIGGLFTHAGDV
jgi:hypothetical protein